MLLADWRLSAEVPEIKADVANRQRPRFVRLKRWDVLYANAMLKNPTA